MSQKGSKLFYTIKQQKTFHKISIKFKLALIGLVLSFFPPIVYIILYNH